MDPREGVAAASEGLGPALRLDRLLRFEAWVAERYERERGTQRVLLLRQHTYVGLILYNVHNLADILLIPDLQWMSLPLRVLVVTPVSLLLVWMSGHVSPKLREAILVFGLLNAFALPAFLFWLTTAPLGAYVFGQFALIFVYGNMLLLRFPQAIIFTVGALAIAITTTLIKPGLPEGLQGALVIEAMTASVFTLYANYRSETVRCRAYLEELSAILRAEAADAARHRFLDLSLTDTLTTLPNRRFLDQTVERWSRDNASMTVIMIDVDHFKLFNDTLGHPAGDECLRLIAAALSGVKTCAEHFVARFGGEEFTVVVRDLDLLRAARLARQLVDAVAALGLVHPGRTDGLGVVTVSVGVALKPADMDLKTAFKLADDALYAAKRGGRNRYILADSAVDLSVQLAPA